MKKLGPRRWLRRVAFVGSAVVAAYGSLLLWPQLVFAHETRAGNVVLHSRGPLPPQALEIAERARQRVARSPFYDAKATYDVFLCDTSALFAVFAPRKYKVGGRASGFTNHIFLRPARIERDRLIGYSGAEPSGDRTLTYFIAHEITHVMLNRHLGPLRHYRLAEWQREGYADYVAKAGAFDFPAVKRDFQAHAPALDPQASGLYLRYHLLVAHLLDHEGMTPQALVSAALDPAPLERELAR